MVRLCSLQVVAILYNIRSLHNVGSIFRTADAVGVEKIYLCGITPAPTDRFGKVRSQFAKVALGAEQFVEWKKCGSTSRLITELKNKGYKIVALEQSKKAIPYYKLKVKNRQLSKVVLIVGNEVRGVPHALLKKCDAILEIPMHGVMVRHAHHPRHIGQGKESLNVAVAFGIVVFHLTHARK